MQAVSTARWGEANDVLGGLCGEWILGRSIEGHATMTGKAIFTPVSAHRLHYREDGTLRLVNGVEFAAEREYIYAPRENGFAVLFAEDPPRLFHEVALAPGVKGEWRGEADHPCGEDIYRSSYRFLPDGRFIVRHVVSGPRKGYTMVTSFASPIASTRAPPTSRSCSECPCSR